MLSYELIGEDSSRLPEIAGVMKVAFDGWDVTPEFLAGKYFGNPYSEGVTAAVATNDGKVVALLFSIPQRHIFNGREYKSVLNGESAALPEYQRGILLKLLEMAEEFYAAKGYDFFIGFPNKSSSIASIRRKWRNVFTFNHYVLPAVFPRGLWDIAMGSRMKKFADDKRGTNIVFGDATILAAEDYAKLNAALGKVFVKKSPGLYDYKLRDEVAKNYFVKVLDGEKLKSLLVLKEDKRKVKGIPLTFLDIIDYKSFANSAEEERSLLAQALTKVRGLGFALVIWEPTAPALRKTLADDFGFKNMSKLHLGKSEHYLYVKALNEESEFVYDKNNWNLNWIEADI